MIQLITVIVSGAHWRSQELVLRLGPEDRGAYGAEFETLKASRGMGMGRRYPPPKPTRVLGERRKLPQRGR